MAFWKGIHWACFWALAYYHFMKPRFFLILFLLNSLFSFSACSKQGEQWSEMEISVRKKRGT